MASFSIRLARIARNRIESPRPLPGGGVIRIEETASLATIAAGDPDDHFAAGNPGRHGDVVSVLGPGDAGLPHRFARNRIERKQPSIDARSEDLAVVERKSAIRVNASRTLIDLRIPPPDLLAGAGVDGIHHAPGGNAVDRVVPDQRRAFLVAAARAHHIRPRESETLHVRSVDLFQRAVARLALGFPVGQPGAGELVIGSAGVLQGLQVDHGRLLRASRGETAQQTENPQPVRRAILSKLLHEVSPSKKYC